MHHVEFDQSGRTEKQNEPSALAFSNDVASSILIPAREKRIVYQTLKDRYHKLANKDIRVFVAALFLLFKDHIDPQMHITIDLKFDGHNKTIKSIFLRHIRTVVPAFPAENIEFVSIGKKSPAHDLAHRVFLKKQSPSRVIKARDILPLI